MICFILILKIGKKFSFFLKKYQKLKKKKAIIERICCLEYKESAIQKKKNY